MALPNENEVHRDQPHKSLDQKLRDRLRVLNKGRSYHMGRLYRCRRFRRRCEKELAIYEQKIQQLEGSVDPVASIDMEDDLLDKMGTLAIDQESNQQPGEPVDVSEWMDLRDRLLEKMAENEAKYQELQRVWEEKYLPTAGQVEFLKDMLRALKQRNNKAEQPSTGDAMVE